MSGTFNTATSPALDDLRAAFRRGHLALYLGAGVSISSGMLSWEGLVLALYYSTVSADWTARWRPYPNYLFALAEWQLRQVREPLDITARKLRQLYNTDQEFMEAIRRTLYAGLRDDDCASLPNASSLLAGNPTLAGIADLCAKTVEGGCGVAGVVSYNYDNLLESVLGQTSCRFAPVWCATQPDPTMARPIIHVHGYIPATGSGSSPDGIVFTEQQYYAAAHSPYSWSNLAQIQCLSSHTGLMIGLSLSDRNLRRLLDAMRLTPLRQPQYALLRQRPATPPSPDQMEAIHAAAQRYFQKFEHSGIKRNPSSQADSVLEIFSQLDSFEAQNNAAMLSHLGITPIWYADHADIPLLLKAIAAP